MCNLKVGLANQALLPVVSKAKMAVTVILLDLNTIKNVPDNFTKFVISRVDP